MTFDKTQMKEVFESPLYKIIVLLLQLIIIIIGYTLTRELSNLDKTDKVLSDKTEILQNQITLLNSENIITDSKLQLLEQKFENEKKVNAVKEEHINKKLDSIEKKLDKVLNNK